MPSKEQVLKLLEERDMLVFQIAQTSIRISWDRKNTNVWEMNLSQLKNAYASTKCKIEVLLDKMTGGDTND